MMFCGNCGNRLPDGSKFCPVCGAKAEETAPHVPVTSDPVSAPAEEVAGQILGAAGGDIRDLQRVMFEDLGDPGTSPAAAAVSSAVSSAAQDLDLPSIDPNALLGELAKAAGEPDFEGIPVPELPQLETVQAVPQPQAPVQNSVQFPSAPQQSSVSHMTHPSPSPAIKAEDKKKGGKKGGKAVIAALLIIALLAAGFLVYWNLPDTKFSRYMSQAIECIGDGDLGAAADLYLKCYELKPGSIEALEAIIAVRNEEERLSEDAILDRDYEEALEHAKVAYRLYVGSEAGSDDAQFTLTRVYYEWGQDLARKGDSSAEAMIQRAADEGLSEKYIEMVRQGVSEGQELFNIEKKLEDAAAAAVSADRQKDYAAAFSALTGVLSDLIDYGTEYSGMFPVVMENGGYPVYWNYEQSSNSAQMRIGGLKQGEAAGGWYDTYFVSNASYTSHSYEFFSSQWNNSAPDGEFYEIDFSGQPAVPTDTNCVIVTGKVKESLYDGDISHTSRGKTYMMKFINGKVQVLDTVDPNGEQKNVVGYTEDHNSWISYRDEQLSANFGIRCIDIPGT